MRLDTLFLRRVAEAPDHVFLRERREQRIVDTTWEQAARDVAAVAERLVAAGYRPGDRIVCEPTDIKSSIEMLLACLQLRLVPAQATRFISREQLVARTGAGPHAESHDAVASGNELDDTEPCHIQPTSGTTTGRAKLVVRSHRSLAWGGTALASLADLERPRFLMPGTATGAGGGLFMVAAALLTGGELAIGDASPSLEDLAALDPHVVAITLPTLSRLSALAGGWRIFGPSARAFFAGTRGEAMTRGRGGLAPLLREISDHGIRVASAYGLAEATGFVALTPPGPWREATVWGRLLPGVEHRLGPDGELQLRSPGVMVGYFDDPEATRAAFTEDGFLRTGDCVRVSGDRDLVYCGRRADAVRDAAGEWIHPGLIERLVERDPHVTQVVAIVEGRAFVSVLVVVDDRSLTDEHVREQLARVNRELPERWRVRRFRLLDRAFPEELYRLTDDGTGDARYYRNRPRIAAAYAEHIDELYGPDGTRFAVSE